MESKKAKLMADISKNIVEQYLINLEDSIQQSEAELDPNNNEQKYAYENYVERAKRHAELVRDILTNYDASLFDGAILEGETLISHYNEKGRIYKVMKHIPGVKREDIEIQLMQNGIKKMFTAIGINPECLNYVLYASMQMLSGDYIINESEAEKYNENLEYGAAKPADISGYVCNAGRININNVLTTDVTLDTKTLLSEIHEPVLYPQAHDLLIDARPIHRIIEQYLKEKLATDVNNEWRKDDPYINGLYEKGFEITLPDEDSLKEFVVSKKQDNAVETYKMLGNMRISGLLTWYKREFDDNLKYSWNPYQEQEVNKTL